MAAKSFFAFRDRVELKMTKEEPSIDRTMSEQPKLMLRRANLAILTRVLLF